jgi:hypothetical protein
MAKKRFSSAEAPDRPLTLDEAAELYGLSPRATESVRSFVSESKGTYNSSEPSRGRSNRKRKSTAPKAAPLRKYASKEALKKR